MYTEELKLMKNQDSLNTLAKLFNLIYQSGQISVDWQKSTFVTLPKSTQKRNVADQHYELCAGNIFQNDP